jgi:hypothetical protein
MSCSAEEKKKSPPRTIMYHCTSTRLIPTQSGIIPTQSVDEKREERHVIFVACSLSAEIKNAAVVYLCIVYHYSYYPHPEWIIPTQNGTNAKIFAVLLLLNVSLTCCFFCFVMNRQKKNLNCA